MQVRFLLGPSGTGKTFRCLAEIRAALLASPVGPPLVFLSPKQATFQLERQLLADGSLQGYTRLQILSFDQLAELILTKVDQSPPQLLSEEGRLMVLRALLSQKRDRLKLFRSTARLRGFAQQLSILLREFQRSQISPEQLISLAAKTGLKNPLNFKLQDLAEMLRAYLDWLQQHDLQDNDLLIDLAVAALRDSPPPSGAPSNGVSADRKPRFGALWFDGFAELAPQEIALLTTLLPFCDRATLAFNLDRESIAGVSWLSTWSAVGLTFRQLQKRLADRADTDVVVEWLDRNGPHGRFANNPILRHLENHWSQPKPFSEPVTIPQLQNTLRVALCANPEAEATLAAREILRFVRAGGRYREVAVVVRQLDNYYEPIRRVFTSFDIPFFLDRREPVGHHPLAELTRSAVRTAAFGWESEDWFGALKTGLVHRNETEIDRLENEALAHGWKGLDWLQPLTLPDNHELNEWLEPLREKLVEPFQELAEALTATPSNSQDAPLASRRTVTGIQLAEALRAFWRRLKIEEQLQGWSTQSGNLVHISLWQQMHEWLDNLALAFPDESLSLMEWLPILEAGLSTQTVGVIPPALDQVLVGAVDRSRNPDLNLAIILGLNESVFPAVPSAPILLTESDREQLSQLGADLGQTTRSRIGQEQYLGYIACTRSRSRLVLTCATRDENEKALNPSPFLAQLQRLFPTLRVEAFSTSHPWLESEHPSDLIGPLLRSWQEPQTDSKVLAALVTLPAFAPLRKQIEHFQYDHSSQSLSPALAERLYGTTLRTSVSGLEDFAACPFKFLVSSGLKAEERRLFEVDARELGSFQHEVLARFHQELRQEGKRWREVTPQEGRQRIGEIAQALVPKYREGLFQATDQGRFTARSLTSSLKNFIETILSWMSQYQFEPHAVELAFGLEEKPLPAWELNLGEGHHLSFRGKIDRVDLWRNPDRDEALCVVIDYKSSAKRLDPVLVAHGVQLQLPAYLNVLRDLADPRSIFGVGRLIPAGVFYVNLRGHYEAGKTRQEVLESSTTTRKLAYRHAGRFDVEMLSKLDCRADAAEGDQFNYRITNKKKIHGSCREVMSATEFAAMLDGVESHLTRMGKAIFAGGTSVDPYRKGSDVACAKCSYLSVCRIDPWTHTYRVLRKTGTMADAAHESL